MFLCLEVKLTLKVEEKQVGHLVTFQLFRERERERERESWEERVTKKELYHVVRWLNPEFLSSQVERSYWN